MLRVEYGTFSQLEAAFIERLSALVSGRLITPVAIVAPSRRMADRLEELAAERLGGPAFGVQFHTFNSLALRITEEGGLGGRTLIGDPLFHSRLMDKLLEDLPEIGRQFGGAARPRALASALRASIRDLIDANVSAPETIEHLGELFESSAGSQALRRLLELQHAYCGWLDRHEILVSSGLPALAAERAATSAYLASFKEILYYGFYDLTGRQLEFFEQVSSNFPATCFYPYVKDHPAFRFCNEFFELKLHRDAAPKPAREAPSGNLAPALEALFSAVSPQRAVPAGSLRILNASGAYDEAWCVSKEILRLAADEGVDFNEIGVVARTLEPYRAALSEALSTDAVPHQMFEAQPLKRHPLAKACLDLLTLKRRDFSAEMISDLLHSQYFQSTQVPKNLRGRVSRFIEGLGVRAGWPVWQAKLEAKEPGLLVLLTDIRNGLAVEGNKSWGEWAACARRLLESYLTLPRDVQPMESEVWETLTGLVDSLGAFEPLGPVDWEFFLDALIDKFESAALEPGSRQGVRVMDAMDARGHSFKILFLVGMQDGVFPRQVREDPLLRDGERTRLRHPGGYWIGAKMAGYDEERLLFYLTVASARERLYCVYSRSDHDGKVRTPSIYLRELCRAAGLSMAEISRRVPRQPLARLKTVPPLSLSPKEVLLRLLDEKKDAAEYLDRIGAGGDLLRGVLPRLKALNAGGTAGPMDGIVGEPKAYLRRLLAKGLSPRALDEFAQCPFQFFASRVLELEEEEDLVDRGELSAALKGTIYHKVLETFYRDLLESGYWKKPDASWPRRLDDAAEKVFAENHWRDIGLYPVAWKAARLAVADSLHAFVEWDMKRIAATGLVPSVFEKELRGALALPKLPKGLEGLEFHGITDRIDLDADGHYQVVDYKSRWKSDPLHKLILAGKKNQMPIYAELIRSELSGGKARTLNGAPVYVVEGEGDDAGFMQDYPAGTWAQDKKAVFEGLSAYIEEIAGGRFPIRPKDGEFGYCSYCAFSSICRKSHGRTRQRAEAAWAESKIAKIHERKRTKGN